MDSYNVDLRENVIENRNSKLYSLKTESNLELFRISFGLAFQVLIIIFCPCTPIERNILVWFGFDETKLQVAILYNNFFNRTGKNGYPKMTNNNRFGQNNVLRNV